VAVGQGLPMHTSVAAAKGAIEALVRTWAAELSPAVRVNGIAPALTNTPLAEKFLSSEDKRKAMAARYPLGRFGEIDDIAAATEYLLSEQSSWMTGQVLGVDGGMSTVRK
jgi:3-oxoacyl-[acyl-carrier protein] reductase